MFKFGVNLRILLETTRISSKKYLTLQEMYDYGQRYIYKRC
jgi:hypothetical protein